MGTEPEPEPEPEAEPQPEPEAEPQPNLWLDQHVASAWALFERLGRPRYWLAPMVGQSEPAFRMLARSLGADICSTEMIDIGGYAKSAEYRSQFPFFERDRPLIVQLGGADRGSLIPAAQLVEATRGCDAIEINAGCPQACARKGRYGAFLMDDPAALCGMVQELRNAVSLPILVKIRVFVQHEPTVALAKRLEAAGCTILTVHGRTRNQAGKTGRQCRALADWTKIASVKRALRIPVIANGNVRKLADAERCLDETGCDGIMSGCGILADPALFVPTGAERDTRNCVWQGPRPSCVECALLYCERYALQYCAHDKAIVKHLQNILGKAWLGAHTNVRELIVKYRGEPNELKPATSSSGFDPEDAPAATGVATPGSLAEIAEAIQQVAEEHEKPRA